MAQKLNHYAVAELPSNDKLVIGGIYYLANGSQYIINSAKVPVKISDVVFLTELPLFGIPDKLYILSNENGVSLLIWEGLRFVEISNSVSNIKSNTFVFFTNRLLSGEVQTRAVVPYNAKVTKLDTVISNVSDTDLKYRLEKSTDGITFTAIGDIETIITGSVLQATNIVDEVLVDKDDILRLVLLTDNSSVKGLTVNILIEERI